MRKISLAVFISGQGSNLNIFLNNKEKFKSLLVVSSNEKAYGLVRAKNHNVPSQVLEKEINWKELSQTLKAKQVDLIFLAGFMKIIPANFIESWRESLYNLHPSMLPKYKGLNAIKKAYLAKDEVGVTIHKVTPEVDSGQIEAQDIAITKEQIKELSLERAIEETHKTEHKMVQSWIDKITERSPS